MRLMTARVAAHKPAVITIGVRERSHFTLHMLTHNWSVRAQSTVERIHHVLIAVFGAIAAWYGVKLCLLNRTLVTPGLEINLALLYRRAVSTSGGSPRLDSSARGLPDTLRP